AGNQSFTPQGIRVTENHNKQEGWDGLPGTSISTSCGNAVSGIDLIDINGDGIPDQLSTAGIRYASYNPAAATGTFGPDTPTVKVPGTLFRRVEHRMYTSQIGGPLTSGGGDGSHADSQQSDSGGGSDGVQISVNGQ